MKLNFWSMLATGVITIALIASGVTMETDKAIKKVPTTHKVVALTFDDGPDPKTTPALLAVLQEKQAKATFFVLGQKVERFPSLTAAILKNGHEIGSHGYSHKIINRVTPAEFEQEISAAERAIAGVAPKPTLFRPAGGGYNDRLVEKLRQRGYTTVLWSVDPRDWDGRSVTEIVDTVMHKTEPGSIILLHEGDCATQTPKALEIIIDRLRAQGYEFVTISELLQYYEIRP